MARSRAFEERRKEAAKVKARREFLRCPYCSAVPHVANAGRHVANCRKRAIEALHADKAA